MKHYTHNSRPLTVIKVDDTLSVVVDEDAEIKEGNWFIYTGTDYKKVFQSKEGQSTNSMIGGFNRYGCQKIICTIERRLDGVPVIVEKIEVGSYDWTIKKLAEIGFPKFTTDEIIAMTTNCIQSRKGYTEEDMEKMFLAGMKKQREIKTLATPRVVFNDTLAEIKNSSQAIDLTDELLKQNIIYV